MAEPFHWEIIDNPGKRGVVSLSSYWQILRMQSQAEFLTKGSLFVKREFGSPPPPLFWAILRSIFFSFSESLYQEPYLCSVTCKQTLQQWKPPSAGYWFWWNKSWLSRMVAFFFFLNWRSSRSFLSPVSPRKWALSSQIYRKPKSEGRFTMGDTGRKTAIWQTIEKLIFVLLEKHSLSTGYSLVIA